MRWLKWYMEDKYNPPPTTKNSIVESGRNAIDYSNSTVESPRMIQRVNLSSMCSMLPTSTHDKTTPHAHDNLVDLSKSEPIEKSVLELEKQFFLEGRFY